MSKAKRKEKVKITREEAVLMGRNAPIDRWIKACVHVEDPDTGGAIPFDLWPAQERALKEMHENRLSVVLKARQLGLSWLALAYAAHQLVYKPGFRITALSKDGEAAKELVRRMILIFNNVPSWVAIYKKPDKFVPGWEGTTERVNLFHPGGEISTFQALTASKDAGRTFSSGLVIIDEWAFQEYAYEIWNAAYPTINRPGGGKLIGISTGERGTLYQEVWEGAVKGENGFHPIFLPWSADPRRDVEWYEQTKKAMPLTYMVEYPSTPEEAFMLGEGAAFPEWNPMIHAPSYLGKDWYPPRGWRLYRAYDGGWNQASCGWYAIDPDGNVVRYREYYPSKVTDEEQARAIVAMSKAPDGSSEDIAFTVADPACWAKRSDSGLSTAEVFSRNGVHMRPGSNDRINGWKRFHEYLRPFEDPNNPGTLIARFRVTQSCVNAIRTIPALPADRHRPDDVNTRAEDHCFVAGTMVETDSGEVPIEMLQPGMKVLTRKGYRRIKGCGATRERAEVFEVVFSDGRTLVGTGNHPVWVENKGFVRLDSLRYGDIMNTRPYGKECLECQKNQRQLFTKGLDLEDTQSQRVGRIGYITDRLVHTSKAALATCTKKFGKNIMGRYRKVITSITKTMTPLTMTLKTWNLLKQANTCQSTILAESQTWSTLTGLGSLQKSGTVRKREESGIANTQRKCSKNESRLQKSAAFVEMNSRQRMQGLEETPSVQTNAEPLTGGHQELTTKQESAKYAGNNLKSTNITNVAHAQENAVHVCGIYPVGIDTVYNLTVEEVPEYYANGVLVHNCADEIRYLLLSRPATPESEEEVKRRRYRRRRIVAPSVSRITGY